MEHARPVWLPSASRAGCSNSIPTVRRIEWKAKVGTATVPAGPVVLQVVNGGQVEHALEVEGKGLERTVPIASGVEGALNLALTPGGTSSTAHRTAAPISRQA
jgi:hypothetical protein